MQCLLTRLSSVAHDDSSPAARSQHRGRHPFDAHKVRRRTKLPPCWKLLSPSHLPALNQQHTLHNTRSIQVQDGFRFHVIFDRDDRLIHPILCCTDGAVRKLMAPSRATKVATPWAYAPKRGVSACRAGLPTCDPSSESLASFMDIQIKQVDPRIAMQPIHHASQHEDLLALSTPVQESSLAMELLRHVLSFANAAATSDDSVIENGGYQSWIFIGAERSREVRGIPVLVQVNQAESLRCRYVHECQLHVATTWEDSGRQGRLWILQRHSNPNSCRNNTAAEEPSASEPACLQPLSQSSYSSKFSKQ